MGYWKREYTEGKGGRPLFKPEPKDSDEAPAAPPERPEDDQTRSESSDSSHATAAPASHDPPPLAHPAGT